RLLPEPELVAVGEGVAVTVAVAVEVAVAVSVVVWVLVTGGAVVSPWVGVPPGPAVAVIVAVRLGKLLIALWAVLPHPAARHPATRTTTGKQSPFVEHRMSVPPP